jgi:hypothetical protein
VEDHVDRKAQMGTRVLFNDGWYNFAQSENAPWGTAIRPDAQGFLNFSRDCIFNVFAQDLGNEEKAIVFATQGTTSGAALGGVVPQAAWRTKPSWYLIGDQGQVILPALLLALSYCRSTSQF